MSVSSFLALFLQGSHDAFGGTEAVRMKIDGEGLIPTVVLGLMVSVFRSLR
jgi:hypothetical protein